MNRFVFCPKAKDVRQHQDLAAFFPRACHSVTFGEGQSIGFFEEHMLARIERGDGAVRSRLFGQGMPLDEIERLTDAGFYATLAHETTHWTKHPSRIQRDFGRKT